MCCLESGQFAFETRDKIYYPCEKDGKQFHNGIDKPNLNSFQFINRNLNKNE